MKNTVYLLLFLSVLLFCGCSNTNGINHNDSEVAGSYTVIEIDGCEYVVYNGRSYDGGICHKGSCRNVIHRGQIFP